MPPGLLAHYLYLWETTVVPVHQRQEAIKPRDVDGEPIRDIAARSYNVHNSTISRLTA
jgi:hypothetical protein